MRSPQKHLLEFLREIDRTYPKSLILFEDLYSSPEDSGLANCRSRMVTLDSEVYHVASSNDANDTLLTSLREAATAVQTSVMAFTWRENAVIFSCQTTP